MRNMFKTLITVMISILLITFTNGFVEHKYLINYLDKPHDDVGASIEPFRMSKYEGFINSFEVLNITPTVNRSDNFEDPFNLYGSPTFEMIPGNMLLIVIRTRVNRQSLNNVRDDNREMFIRLSSWARRDGVDHHIVWNNYNDSRFNELANSQNNVTRLSHLGDNITINGNIHYQLGARVRANVSAGSSPRLTGNFLTSRTHYSTMGIIIYNNSTVNRSVRIAGNIAPANQLRSYDPENLFICWCFVNGCMCATFPQLDCGCPQANPQPTQVSIASWVQHVYRQRISMSGRIVARSGERIYTIQTRYEVSLNDILDNYLTFSEFGNIASSIPDRFSQFNNAQKATIRDENGITINSHELIVNAKQEKLIIDVEVRDAVTAAYSVLATRFMLEIQIIDGTFPSVNNVPVVYLKDNFNISWQYIVLMAYNQGMSIRDSANREIPITQVRLMAEYRDSIIDNQISSFGNRVLYLYVVDNTGRRVDFVIITRLINHYGPNAYVANNSINAITTRKLSITEILMQANVFVSCRIDGQIPLHYIVVYSDNYFRNYNKVGLKYVTFKVANRQGIITRFTIHINITEDNDINNYYIIMKRENSGAVNEDLNATLIFRNIENPATARDLARNYLVAYDQQLNDVTYRIRIANEEVFVKNIYRYGRFNLIAYIYNSNGPNTYHTLVVYNNEAPDVTTINSGETLTVNAMTILTESIVRYLIIYNEVLRVVANSWPQDRISFYTNDFVHSINLINNQFGDVLQQGETITVRMLLVNPFNTSWISEQHFTINVI